MTCLLGRCGIDGDGPAIKCSEIVITDPILDKRIRPKKSRAEFSRRFFFRRSLILKRI
jgi:hypothetical protein